MFAPMTDGFTTLVGTLDFFSLVEGQPAQFAKFLQDKSGEIKVPLAVVLFGYLLAVPFMLRITWLRPGRRRSTDPIWRSIAAWSGRGGAVVATAFGVLVYGQAVRSLWRPVAARVMAVCRGRS